ncbi:phosphoribosylpyrophosphate synthetase [Fulvivirga sp. 29W222]|uniref:Phosphoribosylpyrophosphate synthetase n=1 Tax=Fulvivirga marina TaxID=2494733 RepID=A0A937KCC9_9BACT|nr:phosphoribosylpyrophosphate synthetase [Fulvivirga marina]MBL6445113.1 phosphoribosylpyrophosphate synthetase [Fulvivirga marina]
MSTHNLKSMSEVINTLKDRGYTLDFIYRDNKLFTSDKKKSYNAEELTIVGEYRFEGDTDPSDEAILYSIESQYGDKGTLVDSYGVDSSPELEKFLKNAHYNETR